jgi:hypothetical protein
MNIQDKIEYNKTQALKNGWSPDWFGCTAFDEKLIQAITDFQAINGLGADGLCGSGTFRAKYTERQQHLIDTTKPTTFGEYILYKGNRIPIFWDKVVTFNEKGGRLSSKGNYSDYSNVQPRKINFFVTHWDVCLSSDSCFNVLEQRKISIHFGIDNDGTIYQWQDLEHACFHAGGKDWNHSSVGVEISNAYDLKYQEWYIRKGFGARPIVTGATCHGKKMDSFLGFYDVQLKALSALWECISFICDIPLELPKTKNTVDPECVNNTFRGFCNHYHLTERKIDCAGLDNEKVLQMAKELRKKR